MPDLKNRRVVLAIGAGVAVVAGLGVAVVMVAGHGKDSEVPPPASQGGLVIQTGRDDDIKLDPARPLHCFVNGQLVGDLPLNACAKRNGVATGALDVGLDTTGALAAANGGDTTLTPLPPGAADTPQAHAANDLSVQPPPVTAAEAPVCWRRGAGAWRKVSTSMSLEACVQTLFSGRCLPPDAQPVYGRWGDNMLRLVPGEVEISDDDWNFRGLIDQGPDCSIAPISSQQ